MKPSGAKVDYTSMCFGLWLFLVWLVAKPTACQNDNQQCWYPKADEGGQVHAGHADGEKEWYPSNLRGTA